ncbi:alpha/beta hydrolase [Mycolicibacterium flavescens]|uniref:Esterase n=1 Tax=Mycolicibacterium flavescens TaxID=1776 RepID=A0A1E3RKS1_MYCFV|nr:alpha/beta hydrolase [Mycolicibacterium flavescens]MCV7278976.1 alpha/beta hydrolase [Mycolicibacterium flavescens]ODQ90476.1 esterase [Mycolicibacterium flavescens]
MDTVEYSPGRAADIYGDISQSTVMMWHGAQTDSRAAMRPLAERVHRHGATVVLADWDSHADDGGRADLVASARFAAERCDGRPLVLVGWSMGGLAAAGLTFQAAQIGVDVAHTVCLAGAFMVRDPISAGPLPSSLSGTPTPFTLLHGADDDVIPADASGDFAAVLTRNSWPVDCVVLAADHGSIAGATYDPGADRYSPAVDAATLEVADDVAARIAAVL